MSSKADITRSKQMLIAPEQFNNIKPYISITLRDVPLEQLDNASSNLEDVVDGLFRLEVAYQYHLYQKIKRDGLEEFSNDVLENINDTIENIEKSMDNLIVITREEKF